MWFIDWFIWPDVGHTPSLNEKSRAIARLFHSRVASQYADLLVPVTQALAWASNVAASLTSNLPGPSLFKATTLPSLTNIE